MTETTFQVRISAPLLRYGFNQEYIQKRITEWLVISLFTDGYASSGKAARLLNISRVEFLALLRARGVAYVNYTSEELDDEFAAVESLKLQPNWFPSY